MSTVGRFACAVGTLALVGLFACEPDTGTGAIERGAERWTRALNDGDPARLVEPYEAGAVLLAPGRGAVVGRDEIREAWADWFHRYDLVYEFEVEGLSSDGRIGYRYGTYRIRGVDREEARSMEAGDRFMQIWRRQRDGSWRIALDQWDPPAEEARFLRR